MQMPIHFYDDGEFITSPLYSNRTVVSDLFSACEDVKFTVSTPPDAGGCSPAMTLGRGPGVMRCSVLV